MALDQAQALLENIARAITPPLWLIHSLIGTRKQSYCALTAPAQSFEQLQQILLTYFPNCEFAWHDSTTDIAITGNLFTGLIEEAVRTIGQCTRIALAGNVASDLGRKRGEKLPAFDMSGAAEVSAGLNVVEKGFEGSLR